MYAKFSVMLEGARLSIQSERQGRDVSLSLPVLRRKKNFLIEKWDLALNREVAFKHLLEYKTVWARDQRAHSKSPKSRNETLTIFQDCKEEM